MARTKDGTNQVDFSPFAWLFIRIIYNLRYVALCGYFCTLLRLLWSPNASCPSRRSQGNVLTLQSHFPFSDRGSVIFGFLFRPWRFHLTEKDTFPIDRERPFLSLCPILNRIMSGPVRFSFSPSGAGAGPPTVSLNTDEESWSHTIWHSVQSRHIWLIDDFSSLVARSDDKCSLKSPVFHVRHQGERFQFQVMTYWITSLFNSFTNPPFPIFMQIKRVH